MITEALPAIKRLLEPRNLRHCEEQGEEPIHIAAQRKNGLLVRQVKLA
jgi:hypothetical protein